jgi:hypothetical protein
MSSIKPRLTFANITATLALFISLGGVSWAATTLPSGSVGSRQLQANAVSTRNVIDGSLLSRDFKRGELPNGPAGPTGATGLPRTERGQGGPGAARAKRTQGRDRACRSDRSPGTHGSQRLAVRDPREDHPRRAKPHPERVGIRLPRGKEGARWRDDRRQRRRSHQTPRLLQWAGRPGGRVGRGSPKRRRQLRGRLHMGDLRVGLLAIS